MSTMLAIAGGSALLVALAAGALVVGNGWNSLEGQGCDEVEHAAYAGADGRLVQIRIDNTADSVTGRLCISEDETERYDEDTTIPAASVTYRHVRVSPAATSVTLEIDRPGGELWNTHVRVASRGPLNECDEGVPEFRFTTEYTPTSGGIMGPSVTCAALQPTTSTQTMGALIPAPQENPGNGPGAATATLGVLAIGAVAAAAWHRRSIAFLALGLFTRLVQPKLLEQTSRARIAEAVAADPGVAASAIAKRLGLSRGVAQYHLLVLEREEILSCVATRGFRHYFPLGRFSPGEMYKRALLRQRNAHALYELVKASPGIGPTEVANRLRIPPSRVTALVARLAQDGLIDRTQTGRWVQLRALDLPVRRPSPA